MDTINFLLSVPKMATDDYVGFTFFVGCMAMMAASAFFFLSMSSFDKKWRTSILVSGLITFIAAVHYYYMRDYWATNAESPTFFRYVDWILTVPLMCVEFYLILRAAGATKRLMWILIVASTVMLVTGYMGEGVDQANAQIWGAVSGAAYFYIVYLIWFGEAKSLATSAGGDVLKAHNVLCKFVLIGWAIYPIGYMCMDGGWLNGIFASETLDIWYNIADAINKIGFGLVVYTIAIAETKKETA